MVGILDWLNRNGTAIQAIAAIVAAGSTVVLVLLTRRYVLLTQDLSAATTA